MENNYRKYILIPEYRPLWAMKECFGPTHGPLSEPCPTPLDIIGKLLRQSGDDKVTIMEVVKEGTGFSTPVQLTLDNYTLPYKEIAAGNSVKKSEVIIVKPDEPKEVAPVITSTKESSDPGSVVDDTEPAIPQGEVDSAGPSDDKNEADPDMDETTVVIAEDGNEDETDETTETPAAVDSDTETQEYGVTAPSQERDPYAGMTKSQRRAARRAAEAAKNAEAAQQE